MPLFYRYLHLHQSNLLTRRKRYVQHKILARYASQGAVYRELLQNANDADAKTAEISFTTASSSAPPSHIEQVVFRNDGVPFRPSDWSRLRNIAEGNPDVSKVGAFGVGFYSVFSVCDEPLVVSGNTALTFLWRGDSLWARSGPVEHPDKVWTSFVLPSRDAYPVPNLLEFAQFLCTSLTFTRSLNTIRLFIDDKNVLTISKSTTGSCNAIIPPSSSSWWSSDGMVTHSPNSLFSLERSDNAVIESFADLSVFLLGDAYSVRARYVSARADVRATSDLERRIERVTKKKLPRQVTIHVFMNAVASSYPPNNRAAEVLQAITPRVGTGYVFIGFRTSQTTGVAAHLAAPLVPTVEREAIDLQDPALRVFNSDLLSIAGAVMRLCFEEGMISIAAQWEKSKPERDASRKALEKEMLEKDTKSVPSQVASDSSLHQQPDGDRLSAFMRFMSSGVRKLTDVIKLPTSILDDDDYLLNPPDALPFSREERDAVMLMRAFSPEPSTPATSVGALIANGFLSCMAKKSPLVLTSSGVVCGSDGLLPFRGIEWFVNKNVVRKSVFLNADSFLQNVAGCRFLNLSDLIADMHRRPLSEKDFVRFVRWWVKFCRADSDLSLSDRQSVYDAVTLKQTEGSLTPETAASEGLIRLNRIKYFCEDLLHSHLLPMPPSVISFTAREEITLRLLRGDILSEWFKPLPFMTWARFVANHRCLTNGQEEDSKSRLEVLAKLCKHHTNAAVIDRVPYERWLSETLGKIRCVPIDNVIPPQKYVTEYPSDVYLPDAELGIFQGLGQFRKVAGSLELAGISKSFLVALGVRKAISIDFLFTQLDYLKWNDDPQPLVRYLRSVTLSSNDLEKLRTSQYLPEAKDKSRTYSPSELLLPNEELSIFPFVNVLQWPSASPLHVRSPEAIFLMKLGCKQDPPLESVLRFVADVWFKNTDAGMMCFEYLFKRMGPGGVYEHEYDSLRHVKFLPATYLIPLSENEIQNVLRAPGTCYSTPEAMCMGFPVLSQDLFAKYGRTFRDRFHCLENPSSEQLIMQLQKLSSVAIKRSSRVDASVSDDVSKVEAVFRNIFQYLSTQLTDLESSQRRALQDMRFIPCRNGTHINWYRPGEVYFKRDGGDICSLLYEVIDFDPFLASAGVRGEPSASDLLQLVIRSPKEVLQKLGTHDNYFMLLRRLASSFSSFPVSSEVQRSSFLLGCLFSTDDELSKNGTSFGAEATSARTDLQYRLARADEICIVDNSLFARKFPVLVAPQESDLERFYEIIGSIPISKRVRQSFNVHGRVQPNTSLSNELAFRIKERGPLLTAPKITSRTLRANAENILSSENLTIYQADAITAELSLDGVVKRQDVSCCAKLKKKDKYDMYVTSKLDYFDVGNAVGNMVFKKCHLEDGFLIASLLQASLEQLRERGFPVDRIIKVPNIGENMPQDTTKGVVDAKGVERVPTYSENSTEERRRINPENTDSQGSASTSNGTDFGKSGLKVDDGTNGFEAILKQMFPDCSVDCIRKLLGSNPDFEDLRNAANTLKGKYPRTTDHPREHERNWLRKRPEIRSTRNSIETLSRGERRKIGGGLFGLNNSIKEAIRQKGWGSTRASGHDIRLEGNENSSDTCDRPGVASNPLRSVEGGGSSHEMSPVEDLAQQHRVEAFVRGAASSARAVPASGVRGSEMQVSPLPADLEHSAPSCDQEKLHDLKPFDGPHLTGLTLNSTRVFSQRGDRTSETFLVDNWDAVESFSIVLHNLCSVFQIRTKCVAIMHEGTGGTIAFNASSALFFNVRYFQALHYQRGTINVDSGCYTYWFTTMAHELAHNICRAHDRTHGFITETFVKMHMLELAASLPKFLAIENPVSNVTKYGYR